MEEKKLTENIRYSLHSVWVYDKMLFVLYFFNTFLLKIQPFITIFFPKILFDRLSMPDVTFVELICIIAVFIFLIMATNFLQRYTYGMTSIRFMTYRLIKKRELSSKSLIIPFVNLEDPKILNLYNRAIHACSSWNTGMEGMLRESSNLIMSIFSTVGFVGILLTFDWRITLLLLGVSVTYHLLNKRIMDVDIAAREEESEYRRESEYYANIMSDPNYGKDIRLFHLKEFMSNKFSKACSAVFDLHKKVIHRKNKFYLLLYLLDAVKLVGYFTYLIVSVFRGIIGIGSFMMYINTYFDFSIWLEDIVSSLSKLKRMTKETDDFRVIMEMEEIDSIGNKNVGEIRSIDFRNVWFMYDGANDFTLKDVSFTLSNEEKVSLVGINGSGKTTIVKLICGFYRPTRGEIRINGIPMEQVDRKALRKNLAVGFQENNIFAFSIASNIALCRQDSIDRARVLESIRWAGLENLLNKVPKGIDTVVQKILDDEAIELSGGENQGLVIARIIYKNVSFMILDEPTAHFDALMESQIYQKYQQISSKKLSLFISHRLASTQFCDKILFIENGVLLCEGSHSDLLQSNQKYREMYVVQAKYYNEEGDAHDEANA